MSLVSRLSPCSNTKGMKSGVQPCTGWAAKAGWDPSGDPSALRSVGIPESTRAAAAGSARTILVSGELALSGLVELPVGLRLELVAEEPAVLLRKLCGLLHHAGSLSGLGGDNDLGAEHAHELAAFHAEGLRHGNHALVAPLSAHHGYGDSRVPGGCLDDRVPGLELAFLLCRLDDGKSQTVLDGGKGVGEFGLGIDGHTRGPGHGIAELDHGGVAHHFGNVFEGGTVAFSAGLGGEGSSCSRCVWDAEKGAGGGGLGDEDCGCVEELHCRFCSFGWGGWNGVFARLCRGRLLNGFENLKCFLAAQNTCNKE
ncbi:unnamed protein product [Pseudo-nitzschia multistriata]|uniref:Uncharacterized protein n=1 Tax=Pseudo-nitzschia multistriata TaxID=183589 RepID=A0A448ZA35_9STRA|nr:unnamed protein product [Pseudo-nitzschia multistriata]